MNPGACAVLLPLTVTYRCMECGVRQGRAGKPTRADKLGAPLRYSSGQIGKYPQNLCCVRPLRSPGAVNLHTFHVKRETRMYRYGDGLVNRRDGLVNRPGAGYLFSCGGLHRVAMFLSRVGWISRPWQLSVGLEIAGGRVHSSSRPADGDRGSVEPFAGSTEIAKARRALTVGRPPRFHVKRTRGGGRRYAAPRLGTARSFAKSGHESQRLSGTARHARPSHYRLPVLRDDPCRIDRSNCCCSFLRYEWCIPRRVKGPVAPQTLCPRARRCLVVPIPRRTDGRPSAPFHVERWTSLTTRVGPSSEEPTLLRSLLRGASAFRGTERTPARGPASALRRWTSPPLHHP